MHTHGGESPVVHMHMVSTAKLYVSVYILRRTRSLHGVIFCDGRRRQTETCTWKHLDIIIWGGKFSDVDGDMHMETWLETPLCHRLGHPSHMEWYGLCKDQLPPREVIRCNVLVS